MCGSPTRHLFYLQEVRHSRLWTLNPFLVGLHHGLVKAVALLSCSGSNHSYASLLIAPMQLNYMLDKKAPGDEALEIPCDQHTGRHLYAPAVLDGRQKSQPPWDTLQRPSLMRGMLFVSVAHAWQVTEAGLVKRLCSHYHVAGLSGCECHIVCFGKLHK